MRPTIRRSGIRMATIRIEHTLALDEVVTAVAAWAVTDRMVDTIEQIEDLPRLTRSQIDTIVHDTYQSHGDDADLHVGDILTVMDDDVQEAVEDWASSQVRAAYPEW